MRCNLLFVLFCCSALFVRAQEDLAWMHPNQGQWDQRINYKIDLAGGEMLVENLGFTYLFHNAYQHFHQSHQQDKSTSHEKEDLRFHAIKERFIGANPAAKKQGQQPSTFYRNYFLDADPSKWHSNVHAVSVVDYKQFYPGIDLLLESGTSEFKYSFIVAPEADPSLIQSSIEGASQILLDARGNLIVKHEFGEIRAAHPVAWTIDAEGHKHAVKVNFKLKKNVLTYDFPEAYDVTHTLVIDPSLTFSSYTGSTADNWGNTATPDLETNLYAGGIVFAGGYPVTAGAYSSSYTGGTTSGNSSIPLAGFDMGISKFSKDGSSFLFSTYLGASIGNESPLSLVSDQAGNLYILGTTSSPNFPMVGNPFQANFAGGSKIETASGLDYNGTDIVIIKMAADGTALLNTTFLGGSGNDGLNAGDLSNSTDLVHNYGDNFRGEIILDQNENVIIASTSGSSNFPVKASNQNFGGTQDAVFAKLSPDLSTLVWSTYYGGSGMDAGYSVQSNGAGFVYATGGTNSSNLTMNGAMTGYGGSTDGYLIKINENTGAIANSTYVGTSSYDQSYFVQLDGSDDVYVYGQSNGSMTISPGLYGTATAGQFIRKYNPNLTSVLWTTKVGGASSGQTAISPTAFLVSDCREIYYAGWGGQILGTNISNFPTTGDAVQATSDGDAFYIAVLEKDALALKYATFFGGTAQDHVDGGTCRFDKTGRIYHAVCSSCGVNNGFISTPGVVGASSGSSRCNLAAFKFELNTIRSVVVQPDYVICAPEEVSFVNNSIEGDIFFWDFGDNTTSNEKDPKHFYQDPGVYTVKLVVSDSEMCKLSDSTIFELNVGSHDPGSVVQPPIICRGIPYQLQASGGINYTWSPAEFLDDPNISNPTATIFETTVFSVIIGDDCGYDTTEVTLQVYDDILTVSDDENICIGQSATISVTGATSQTWSPNAFIDNIFAASPVVNPTNTITYFVDATTTNNCVYHDSVVVQVYSDPPIPLLADSAQMCAGRSVDIVIAGGTDYLWSPNLFISSATSDSITVNPPADQYYYCDVSNPCGNTPDSIFIRVITPIVEASDVQSLCGGDTVSLSATGAISYIWSPATFLDNAFQANVICSPTKSISYLVTGTDTYGCTDTAEVRVNMYPFHAIKISSTIYAEIGENILLEAQTDEAGSFVWTPNVGLSCPQCQITYASPNFNINYLVTFTDLNGCVTENNVQILYDGLIYIPNTFTPDGNRHNEFFRAVGEGIDHFDLLIFDRWGELIATLNTFDDTWDGTYKGKDCQDGTYTWKLSYYNLFGEQIVRTGHVNVIR